MLPRLAKRIPLVNTPTCIQAAIGQHRFLIGQTILPSRFPLAPAASQKIGKSGVAMLPVSRPPKDSYV
eukprot:scaffold825_cov249-Pinguiococcus_pyrenoidosus.AAC.31